MQSRSLDLLLAGVACAAALAVSSRARVLAGEKPAADEGGVAACQQLVGEWRLNPELSEDPREKMRQARGEGGRPEGGGPPGGGGAVAGVEVVKAAARATTAAAMVAATPGTVVPAARATAGEGLLPRAGDARARWPSPLPGSP